MMKINSHNIFVFKNLLNNKSNIINIHNKFCFIKNQNFSTKGPDGSKDGYLDQR